MFRLLWHEHVPAISPGMQLKYISQHTYGVWEEKLVEIGKMIGGLMKSVINRPKA